MITVVMRCNHVLKMERIERPVCSCGEKRVLRVKARPPVFTGTVHGPTAVNAPLQAIPVSLSTKASQS